MHDGTASPPAVRRVARHSRQNNRTLPSSAVFTAEDRDRVDASINTSPFNLSTTSRSKRSINRPGLAG